MNRGPQSRQWRRKSRTRTALVAAAEAMFASRGPDGVSVDDIVAAADVAKGSFYNHFTDKDALARSVAGAIRAAIEEKVTACNKAIKDPAIRIARALCVFARFANAEPARARALLQLTPASIDPRASLNEGVRRDVGAGLTSGRLHAPSRESAALFVIGVVQASFQSALSTAIPQKNAAALAALLLEGLGLERKEALAIAGEAARTIFADRKDIS